MAKKLTERQKQVFEFIRDACRADNRPPTVREIAEHFGFRSPKAVTDHLNALERKGYIIRRSRKSRNIELPKEFAPQGVPVVGRIAAGTPILAVENLDGAVTLSGLFEATATTFALRVQGDSMRDAGILDGDYVIVDGGGKVKSGTIAAVLIGEEATVKRVLLEGKQVRLHPENPSYQDTVLNESSPELQLCGPVRGVVRRT